MQLLDYQSLIYFNYSFYFESNPNFCHLKLNKSYPFAKK